MALTLGDRIQETTTTTGTGTITLAGAVSGYQSFATVGNGNTTYYTITSGTAWEVGIGTYSTTGPTLARTTILASSNSGSAITLAGTSNVFADYPAERAVSTDNTATLTNKTLALEAYSTAATVTAGTNAQGQGALTNDINIITTTSSNPSGVTLPTAFVGARVIVVNRGTNPVNVYPATGASINTLSANASTALAAGSSLYFIAVSTTQWYSVGGFAVTTTPRLETTQGGTGLSGATPFVNNGALYATSATTLSTGTLPIASGGTNSTTTPTSGAVAYGTGSAFGFTSAGSSGQALLSNGSSAPSFGTLGYAGGGTGVSAVPNNGELLIGNGSGWTKANLTAGSGISISNGSGSISISASGGTQTVNYLGSSSTTTSPTTITLTGVTTNRVLLLFENVVVTGALQLQFTNSGTTITSGYSYTNIYATTGSFTSSIVTSTSGTIINIHPGATSGSATISGYVWVDGPFGIGGFTSFSPTVNGHLSGSGINVALSLSSGTCSTSISPASAGIVVSGSTSLSGGTIYAYSYQ